MSVRATARAGLAVRVHVTGGLFIQPEIAVVRSISGAQTRWISGGLAFCAGDSR